MNTLRSMRTLVGATLCAGLLGACSTGPDLSGVRTTAQAAHPADSVKRTTVRRAHRADRLSKAQASALSNQLFDRYCLNKPSVRATEAALQRSGKFAAPKTLKTRKARFILYPLADGTHGGVTVAYNSRFKLRCRADVQNIASNLYEDGRITRP